jgi:hypothetical protein
MDTLTLGAFLVIVGSIIGILIVVSITKKNPDIGEIDISRKANELAKVIEFNDAAALFRSAFEIEIQELRDFLDDSPINGENVISLLNGARDGHRSAYLIFRPYMSDSLKPGFDRAWKEYCYPLGGNPEEGSEPFLEYMDKGLQPIDSVKLAIENMEKLLKFAETQS